MREACFQPERPRKGGNETSEGGEWGGTKVGEDREGRGGGTKEEDKARQVINHHVAKYIQDSNIKTGCECECQQCTTLSTQFSFWTMQAGQ